MIGRTATGIACVFHELLQGRLGLMALLVFAISFAAGDVSAQEGRMRPAPGNPTGRPPGVEAAEAEARAKAAKEGENKEGEKSEEDKEKTDGKDEKKEEEEKDNSIKRPTAPPRVPDPREFDVKLDENELIRFTFHGQPWPEALQWLATLSGYSLDWQELPNDYINVATNRPYTLPEVQDLFNRLLFERGYTMARKGQILLVVKIDKLDPSLVPRVDESELLDMPAHDFVKTTFQLPDGLKANEVAEDVKALLSRHAKVQPLMATNRLLIVGLVTNLREASRLINAEHAAATSDVRPREFVIRYARADQVADQVMILLGLDPSSRRTPAELQIETQRLQLFTQMQQRGKDVTKYLRKGDAPTVFLAVNYRQNSIVANAPPEQMKIIERTVKMLDTPSGQFETATNAAQPELKKYKLTTLKTEALVSALEEIADLDPRTRLKTDSDARILFASATAGDHEKIQSIIEDMDGTGRSFEVIWLRRLPADAVAVTVQNLMVGEEKEDDNNRRSYGYFSYRYGRKEKEENPNKGFRVDADIENNRLLLWANESELKEVRNFLIKLGEIPGEKGNPNTVRVLKARDQDATRKLIEQLRAAWPSVSPNELRIEVAPTPTTKVESTTDDSAAVPSNQSQTKFTNRRIESAADQFIAAADTKSVKAVESRPSPSAQGSSVKSTQPASSKPPVTISVTEDGRVIISSADTQALDLMEELLSRIAPPPKDYEVFYLRNALASLVTLNLEEYFEETDSKDNSDDDWRGWYGFDFSSNDDESSAIGLSKRRKIRFIYDYDTNSILVSNATPEQLEIVRDLVKIYDEPASEDSISARRFQMFKIQFAQAEDVAKTVKDVYRDLLSSKDKVFDSNRGGEKEQSSQTTNYYRVYGSDDDKKPKKIKASFAGAISVGVDPISNTVIVSAQEEWMSSIAEMISYLDREAAPYSPTVEVINTKVDVQALQAALSRALGTESSKVQIKQQPQEPKPDQGEERVAKQKSNEEDS